MDILIQISGWMGTLLIVAAYFLVSFKKMSTDKRIYQLMNLFGAIGIGINVFYHSAWPAFVMEIVWALIAILAFGKLMYGNNKQS